MTRASITMVRAVLSLVALFGGNVFAEDKPDIEYGRASGESLRLDAHIPDGRGPFPMVVMVHGGGWTSGDKHKDITMILEPLTKSGEFTWFSINYRMAPTNHWPACFEDVQTAIRWAKAHATEYKGDPHRVTLVDTRPVDNWPVWRPSAPGTTHAYRPWSVFRRRRIWLPTPNGVAASANRCKPCLAAKRWMMRHERY